MLEEVAHHSQSLGNKSPNGLFTYKMDPNELELPSRFRATFAGPNKGDLVDMNEEESTWSMVKREDTTERQHQVDLSQSEGRKHEISKASALLQQLCCRVDFWLSF